MFLHSSLPVTVTFLGPREMGNTGWKTSAFFPHLKLTQEYPEPGYNISNGHTTCVLCRAMHAMRVAGNITLGPVYEEETCLKQRCNPPTQDNLGEPNFTTFPYTTWWTVYTRNKLARLEGWPAQQVGPLALAWAGDPLSRDKQLNGVLSPVHQFTFL